MVQLISAKYKKSYFKYLTSVSKGLCNPWWCNRTLRKQRHTKKSIKDNLMAKCSNKITQRKTIIYILDYVSDIDPKFTVNIVTLIYKLLNCWTNAVIIIAFALIVLVLH